MANFLVIFGRSEAMKDIFLKLKSLQRMETHHGISALVTRASIPGGTIVAIGTALIVDQKLVNLISRTWHQISMLESFYAGRVLKDSSMLSTKGIILFNNKISQERKSVRGLAAAIYLISLSDF